MNDPIVEEVRRYRDEHAKKFNYDMNAICADFRSKHASYIKRLKDIENPGSVLKSLNQVAESTSDYSA